MNVKVNYPEYWAKRKNRISKDLFDKLYETAKREAVVSDEYGSYKPGTFLHRNTIVTVDLKITCGWLIYGLSSLSVCL